MASQTVSETLNNTQNSIQDEGHALKTNTENGLQRSDLSSPKSENDQKEANLPNAPKAIPGNLENKDPKGEDNGNIIKHESKGKYTNSHLLHVITKTATEDQLKTSVKKAIIDAVSITKTQSLNLDQRFKVNIVANREEKSFGYAYVWLVSPEIFNMLIGKNPDGSDRYQLVDDPSWNPPNSESGNWADITDLEDPPKIRKPLGPLIKLQPYLLTEEQRRAEILQLKADLNKAETSTSESMDLMKKLETLQDKDRKMYGEFECGPTYVSDDDKFLTNVLCAKCIPKEITSEDLKNLFLPFVSDMTRRHSRRVGKTIVEEKYPLIGITPKGIAFITFDPASHDALFASKMARKISLVKADMKYNLFFNRVWKSKKKEDRGTEKIVQEPIQYFDTTDQDNGTQDQDLGKGRMTEKVNNYRDRSKKEEGWKVKKEKSRTY